MHVGREGEVGMKTECGKDKLRDYKKVAMHVDYTDPVIGLWRNVLGTLLFPSQSEIEQGRCAGIMSFSKWENTTHLMQLSVSF